MIGSAVQNVIALTDSVFLYHLSETDFAAIGFVGVFYLAIAAIGYGFSKGAQIIIARRAGQKQPKAVGKAFYTVLYFELALALGMFLFMQFGSRYFLYGFCDSPVILEKSLEYLYWRSYGIFFSYGGVAIIALYTGTARTNFLVVDTLILAISNFVLNYALVYGRWGLPAMGIGGAALASSIAEVIAFVAYVLYMFVDKPTRQWELWKLPGLDWQLLKAQLRIGLPIVAQSAIGLGSWFVFFSLVENMGEKPLAITNLVRMVYLVMSIPCWGFSSGINTMVSSFIGKQKRMVVMPMIRKTARLSFLVTMILALPVVIWPEYILYPILGSQDMSLIIASKPTLWVLLGILALFSTGSIYFNGLAGTGASFHGLQMQLVSVIAYLVMTFLVIRVLDLGLEWAWSTELVYWLLMVGSSVWYLRSHHWHGVKV